MSAFRDWTICCCPAKVRISVRTSATSRSAPPASTGHNIANNQRPKSAFVTGTRVIYLSREDQIEMALASLDMADRVLKRLVERSEVIGSDTAPAEGT